MATRSPMAEKTRKAHQIDIREAQWVQSVGLVADYQRGRCVSVYNSRSSRHDIDRREKWVYAHALTPMEQWVVHHGFAENPFADRPNRPKERVDKHKSAVYYADGKRRVFLRSEDAYENFESREDAVKLWDGVEGRYTLMR